MSRRLSWRQQPRAFLPQTQKDTLPHDLAWLLMHPLWGFGFFILVNRAVQAEQPGPANGHSAMQRSGLATRLVPKLVAAMAFVGVFSYSLYLTHELVIMQSWWFVSPELAASVEHAPDRRSRNGRLCLVVLFVLRKALYEEGGKSRSQNSGLRTQNVRTQKFASQQSELSVADSTP